MRYSIPVFILLVSLFLLLTGSQITQNIKLSIPQIDQPAFSPSTLNFGSESLGQLLSISGIPASALPAEFKTFEDSVCGISISYPSDWEAQNCGQDLIATFWAPQDNVSVMINVVNSELNTDEYFSSYIAANTDAYQDYSVEESNTDVTLSGNPAFSLAATVNDETGSSKHFDMGTVKDGKAYLVLYTAPSEKYSQYLPVAKRMFDSFKIGSSGQGSSTEPPSATTELPPVTTEPPLTEDCTNTLDDDGDGMIDTIDQDCAATAMTPVTVAEICDNSVDDDLDGLADVNDRDDCTPTEEQIEQEERELQRTIGDIAPNMNEEEVKEKFPITEGELPSDFRTIPPDKDTLTTPRIDYFGEWSKDDLNVYILVDPKTRTESEKFVVDAKRAVTGLSEVLKNSSANPDSFNVNIVEKVNKTSPAADIVILLVADTNGDRGCDDGLAGFANLHDDAAIPLYSEIFTSCLDQEATHDSVYTTVKHEFLHTLGLGHAHDVNGDLMCSIEPDSSGNLVSTCDVFGEAELTEPSKDDIDSILYIYGQDGFGGTNEKVDDYPHYDVNVTSPAVSATEEMTGSPMAPPASNCRYPLCP